MTAPATGFLQLPLTPDDGMPQAVSCPVGSGVYDFAVYVNLDAPDTEPPETVHDLGRPDAAGHLVLRIAAAGRVLFVRKLVPEPSLVHRAGPLLVRLDEARVARGNLGGAGRYGSSIRMGVAPRWA